MSEYFFHNTNENLKNCGEFEKSFFGPRILCQLLKVRKTHDLQKLTSFNFIPNRFQNIYVRYLICNITILCCGNNPIKSVFGNKMQSLSYFFLFPQVLTIPTEILKIRMNYQYNVFVRKFGLSCKNFKKTEHSELDFI